MLEPATATTTSSPSPMSMTDVAVMRPPLINESLCGEPVNVMPGTLTVGAMTTHTPRLRADASITIGVSASVMQWQRAPSSRAHAAHASPSSAAKAHASPSSKPRGPNEIDDVEIDDVLRPWYAASPVKRKSSREPWHWHCSSRQGPSRTRGLHDASKDEKEK